MVPQNNASVSLITGREVSGIESGQTAQRHLVRVELSFLAESRRQVLGLDLLLGHVALVLAEEMLVLDLSGRQENGQRRRREHEPSRARRGPVGGAYLVGLDEGLGPHVELGLGRGGDVATVAVEEWVGAMASHCGRVPVLNDPRPGSDPAACGAATRVRQGHLQRVATRGVLASLGAFKYRIVDTNQIFAAEIDEIIK